MTYSDAYLRKVALSLMVPRMFVEDAMQEMRIAEWQGRQVRSAGIDFLRKITHYNNHTHEARPQAVNFGALDEPFRRGGFLEYKEPVERERPTEELLDLEEALPKLTSKQRNRLLATGAGYNCREIADLEGVSEVAVLVGIHDARRRLKALVA